MLQSVSVCSYNFNTGTDGCPLVVKAMVKVGADEHSGPTLQQAMQTTDAI